MEAIIAVCSILLKFCMCYSGLEVCGCKIESGVREKTLLEAHKM